MVGGFISVWVCKGQWKQDNENHILQHLQQHSSFTEESRCWVHLPAVQIFHLLRTFGSSLNEKHIKDDHKLFSSWKPLSGKNEFQHQNSRNSKPRCPDVYKRFWKEEMLHHGEHVQRFRDLQQESHLKWAHSVHTLFQNLGYTLYMCIDTHTHTHTHTHRKI